MKHRTLQIFQTLSLLLAGLTYMTLKHLFEPSLMTAWIMFFSLFAIAFAFNKILNKKYA